MRTGQCSPSRSSGRSDDVQRDRDGAVGRRSNSPIARSNRWCSMASRCAISASEARYRRIGPIVAKATSSSSLRIPSRGANDGAKVDHGSGGTVPLRRSKTLPLWEPFPVTGRVGDSYRGAVSQGPSGVPGRDERARGGAPLRGLTPEREEDASDFGPDGLPAVDPLVRTARCESSGNTPSTQCPGSCSRATHRRRRLPHPAPSGAGGIWREGKARRERGKPELRMPALARVRKSAAAARLSRPAPFRSGAGAIPATRAAPE